MQYPKAVDDLIDSFLKYPGIGLKTAERLALFTINNLEEDERELFAKALDKAKDIKECQICGMLSDYDTCSICSDNSRKDDIIIVVSDIKDVIAIEKTNSFRGRYHILKGLLNPMDGIGPKDIRLKELVMRLQKTDTKELILALNATLEGEQTSMYIARLLKDSGIKITKLAHGLPVGANLEYADEVTLLKAIEGRRDI